MDGTRMPLARDEGLVIEELGDELLVYDMDRDHAHCLGPAATRVWKHCDGATSVDTIALELGLGNDEIVRALEELTRCELLQAGVSGRLAITHTRRDFGVRAAKAGAAVASVPLIVSIVAPTAAHALTPCSAIPFFGSCGVCNQGGRPTPCCCCHGEGNAPGASPTSCRDNAKDCCCSGPGVQSGADHCTEGKGNPVNCTAALCV